MFYWFICDIFPKYFRPSVCKVDRNPYENAPQYGFARATNTQTNILEQSIFVITQKEDNFRDIFDKALADFYENNDLIESLEKNGFNKDTISIMVKAMRIQAESVFENTELMCNFQILSDNNIPVVIQQD